MTQTNLNPAPAIAIRVSKKNDEISWFSETVSRNTNASDSRNTKLKKDSKKNK
ncbi:hypothetical protein [Flavobacterium hydrophilum]|uniref:hypothetical protein n=1 Tax=Flavobacterium hydrophilum TaxID=2211445 RepID=UPI0014022188|nr:hypothetical protein [Flavobacterium hydrophilum]